MNKGWKSALAVLALAGTALSAPLAAQTYGPNTYRGPNTYGPPANPYPPQGGYGPQDNYPPQNNGYPNYAPGYAPDDPYAPPPGDPYAQYPNYAPPPGGVAFDLNSGGYCDAWGCPDDYWDLPIFYGPVFFGGLWYDGPVYYRDWQGRREFWLHGGWHFDEWRGPRPAWWHEGRYGPALGMNFYRNNGFHGRFDGQRANQRGGGFDQRGGDFNRQGNFAGRFQNNAPQNNTGRGGFRSFGNGQINAVPQNNPAPQDRRGGFAGRGFQPQNTARQDGGFRNFGQTRNNAPPPQQSAPARNNGGGYDNARGQGGHQDRGDRGDRHGHR